MKLKQAFDVIRGDVVAFVGAGGKTATMINLGRELQQAGWRVLATTTAAIEEDQLSMMPHVMPFDADHAEMSDALSEHGFVFLRAMVSKGRVYGPAPQWTRRILDNVDSDVLLIEADGAAGMPLKAPYDDEPYIPEEATLVIPIASLGALDKPLDDEHVYNPQAMVDKYGFYPGSRVRSPWIAQVLRDDELGLRGVPETARVIAFLNETPDNGYLRSRARLIAKLALKSPRMEGVALGDVENDDPVFEVQRAVGAVVLAGGKSSRMGEPKVLLPWVNDKTIIEHIIEQLIRARIDHINVVTGYHASEVRRIVKPMGVNLVHNRAHRRGDMLSSLQAGLRQMPSHISASLMVLGDQPRLEPKVLYQVLEAYAEGAGHLIAPSYQMRRGHPLLIGRRYWSELLDLRWDKTPRHVIDAHADEMAYVNVDTDSVLRDVDTPSDYNDERFRAGLKRMDRAWFRKPDMR
jgi:molybdenum cofactor cytidylyltransferase